MNRLIILGLVLFSYSVTGWSQVVGSISGIVKENNRFYILGWACVEGLSQSINVHVYADNSAKDGGVFLKKAEANLSVYLSRDAYTISKKCRTNGISHHFKIPFTREEMRTFSETAIYIHGVNSEGANDTLTNSGIYFFPSRTSDAFIHRLSNRI
jgi:hypothetical protein